MITPRSISSMRSNIPSFNGLPQLPTINHFPSLPNLPNLPESFNIPEIKFINNIIHILLSVSLIMIFELVLFIYIISPQQKIAMENWFKTLNSHNQINTTPNQEKLIDILVKREDDFINNYNGSLINFFVLFITCIMSIVIYLIINKYNEYTIIHISYSFITVIFIAIFQYSMYLFAQDFKYPSDNEIKYSLYQSIINS